MERWVNGYKYRNMGEGMVGNVGTGGYSRNRRSDWLADCRYGQMTFIEGNIGIWIIELIVEILTGE